MMFREMRRNKQLLSAEETAAVLEKGTSGVLALAGDDGYPYAVPLSYVYSEGKFYFHCARQGHKLDAIRREPKASFCVVDEDRVVAQEYTTYFRSVIAFGQVRELTDEQEKRAAIEKLALRYAPQDSEDNRQRAIEQDWKPLCMLEMTVEHLSGKEAIELIKEVASREEQKRC